MKVDKINDVLTKNVHTIIELGEGNHALDILPDCGVIIKGSGKNVTILNVSFLSTYEYFIKITNCKIVMHDHIQIISPNVEFENCKFQDVNISGPLGKNFLTFNLCILHKITTLKNANINQSVLLMETVIIHKCIITKCNILYYGGTIEDSFVYMVNTFIDPDITKIRMENTTFDDFTTSKDIFEITNFENCVINNLDLV